MIGVITYLNLLTIKHLLPDAEGKNTSRYGINVNVHAGSSVSSEAGSSFWRLLETKIAAPRQGRHFAGRPTRFLRLALFLTTRRLAVIGPLSVRAVGDNALVGKPGRLGATR
jgi:hypothetical protein